MSKMDISHDTPTHVRAGEEIDLGALNKYLLQSDIFKAPLVEVR